MKKTYTNAAIALEGLLFDGMTIAAGGFGLCGIPERLIDAIQASGVKDLTIASNNAGIKGWKADETGSLLFRKTARNFNFPAATCGKVCVAEVEEIVPVGSLDPDCIHLPSIYVNRLILGAPYDKKIEFRTVREREAA